MSARRVRAKRCGVRPQAVVGERLEPRLVLTAPAFYELTVENTFGTGEYYGATPASSDIWLLSNFKFDYQKGGAFVSGNATAGTYEAVPLADVQGGKIRVHAAAGGTRMYAVLSETKPPHGSTSAPSLVAPNNYWEWSFDASGNPGTLDLSWIDSFDFLTRMEVQAKGATSPAPTTVTYGAGHTYSTQAIGDRLATYAALPEYAWLGTATGGFSEDMTFPGATDAVRWMTKNSAAPGTLDASTIGSFIAALDRIEIQARNSPAWSAGTPATGKNWTTAGYRVASTQGLNPPDGSTLAKTPEMWSAYVGFTKDGQGQFTMTLTDFTIYGGTGSGATFEQLWNAHTDAGGATYSLTQADGLLEAIWTSSPNALTSTPTWVTRLGVNGPNLWYALYNSIASGVIWQIDFVANTSLPTWSGYVPWVAGQSTYNFEILAQGAATAGGRTGNLSGSDLVALLKADADLVNPYLLELLQAMEQTPAYLFPSQDFWQSTSVGSDAFIGMQTGPLNGTDVFGDATLTWKLGSGVAASPTVLSGDFNGDGLTDVASRDRTSGLWQATLTAGDPAVPPTTVPMATWSTRFSYDDIAVGDFTGNGWDDIVGRASNGVWWLLADTGSGYGNTRIGRWKPDVPWIDVVVGNFDGDAAAKADIAGRTPDGLWWMLHDTGTTTPAFVNQPLAPWSTGTTQRPLFWSDIVVGNFDGAADGRDEIAGRNSAGQWWMLTYDTDWKNQRLGGWATNQQWVDVVAGRFDDSGRDTIAGRTANDAWWLLAYDTTNEQFTNQRMGRWTGAVGGWGSVVAGDFDGNGYDDVAGRSQASGGWTVTGRVNGSFQTRAFGGAWPTTSVWDLAFAGLFDTAAKGPPVLSGVLGRSSNGSWVRSLSSSAAFTSAAVTGYP